MPLSEVPYLEGWVLLADAARDLGISRQALYEAAGKLNEEGERRVQTIVRVGRMRPVYLIREAELPRIRATLSASHQRRGRLAHEERSDEDQVSGDGAFGAPIAAVG